jgi:hypothetical protein
MAAFLLAVDACRLVQGRIVLVYVVQQNWFSTFAIYHRSVVANSLLVVLSPGFSFAVRSRTFEESLRTVQNDVRFQITPRHRLRAMLQRAFHIHIVAHVGDKTRSRFHDGDCASTRGARPPASWSVCCIPMSFEAFCTEVVVAVHIDRINEGCMTDRAGQVSICI